MQQRNVAAKCLAQPVGSSVTGNQQGWQILPKDRAQGGDGLQASEPQIAPSKVLIAIEISTTCTAWSVTMPTLKWWRACNQHHSLESVTATPHTRIAVELALLYSAPQIRMTIRNVGIRVMPNCPWTA
jgi:hypothetical protein